MDYALIQKMIFSVVGGLGIFLLGMKYMSEGLQKTAGSSLRKMIAAVTSNRVYATVVGIIVTCLVQSSSVTTVMAVGFVNSGIMALQSAIGIILGANVGTTVTGWILVLKIGKWGLPILGVAAFVFLFSKKERLKYLALSLLGIGMVFYGLEVMKGGVKVIKSIPEFNEAFTYFTADSYLGVLACAFAGCILTILVQSSSATLGITIALASQGVIGFESAAALVLGENIGTTITAYLASIGTTPNAKRAAYFHVFFNILGAFWVTALFQLYLPFVEWVLSTFVGIENVKAIVIKDGVETLPYVTTGIASVHTIFNVANVLLFMPFTHIFAKVLMKIVKDVKPESEYITHLDFQHFESPMVSLELVEKEISKMKASTSTLLVSLKKAVELKGADNKENKVVFDIEDTLDKVQVEVTDYVSNLLGTSLAAEDVEEAKTCLRISDELETISDYGTQVLKLVLRLKDNQESLTDIQIQEVLGLHDSIASFYQDVLGEKAFTEIEADSVKITQSIRHLREEHWGNLSQGNTSPLVSTVFPDILNSYRRIKNHLDNVAESKAGLK